MKANKLIPRMWILISMLFTIHNFAQKNIVGYEYAFNGGEGLQYTAIAATPNYHLVSDIDVSALTHNINVFHIRFKDSDGLWSSIISSIFITPPVPENVNTQIVGYEYAFNDAEGLQYVPLTIPVKNFNLITDIDVSALTHNINVFHIRFKDSDGKWSAMISRIFIRPPETSNIDTNIVGYEYAFNDAEGLQYVPITPSQNFNLITDIDVSALPHNINVFHIRFKGSDGKWSAMISKIFIRPPETSNIDTNIVGYEYAFNDAEGLQYAPITPSQDFNLITDIDVSELPHNINVFHIRFKADDGKWSAMISKIFIRPPEPLVYTDNKIISYDYWFDDDVSNKVTVNVETPTADLLVSDIDMSHLWAGEHQIHTQFKDAHNNYSLVMTDITDKQVLPIASFNTNSNSICVGETINFTNNSVDYDAIAWDFDDGNSSTDFNTTHTFNTAGTFDVSLTVSESNSGLNSIATQSIHVYSYPANTITPSGPIEACYGSTVTLTADDADSDYLWSTGETSQSIDVTTNGTYNVTLTRKNSPGCSVVSNDVVVNFDSEIDNSVTIDENAGNVLLTANQSGAIYQWVDCGNGNSNIDGETNQTFSPMVNGDYAVNVSVNNCTVTSDCQNITSLDVNDFSITNLVKLYPNPVKDNLTVKTEIPLVIQVYNIYGMKINTLKFGSGVHYINLKMLNSGLYFLKIKENSNTGNQRQGVFKVLKN